MFNQPQLARGAKAWQPNAGTATKLSSRGYASTLWREGAPEAFADLGMLPKSGGFSAAHYQPTHQPLSQQAQASLALLEGESRNDAFGVTQSDAVAGPETNEHLPFVMDDFGATHKTSMRMTVDPSVLERAEAHAELAETLVLSPITSDDTSPEAIVIHPDESSAQTSDHNPADVLADSHDGGQDSSEASPQAAAHSQDDLHNGLQEDSLKELQEDLQSTSQEHPQDASTTDAASNAGDTIADTAATEGVDAVADLSAVAGGIAADDAPHPEPQLDADAFAKGLAQAREEAELALTEAVAKATEEALAQGMAQGIEQGMAQGMEQGLAQGKAEGEASARAELANEMAAQRVLFENVSNELGALMADPKKFFEPLKRLALHIAEQLVVGELQASSQGIERLVQRCLDELDHPVHGAVVLELNPEDKVRLQAQGGDLIKGMRLEAMPDMHVGSVRVFANDTVVEDLVTHRLEGLAKALLVDVDAWRDKSPLAQRILEVQQEEEAEDGDVHS